MKNLVKLSVLLLIGSLSYYLMELLYRGSSSPVMGLIGGICFIFIGMLDEGNMGANIPIFIQAIFGTLIVTGIEFISGMIFNVWLGLELWNYTNLPFNLYGQICLPYSAFWFGLSLAAIVLDDYLRFLFFKEQMPRYRLF